MNEKPTPIPTVLKSPDSASNTRKDASKMSYFHSILLITRKNT